jgi:hypothetical protein
MQRLKDSGTTASDLQNMASVAEVFETVGLSRMLSQDAYYSP